MSYFNSFDAVSNFITRLEQYGIETPSEILGMQEAVRATPSLDENRRRVIEKLEAAIESGHADAIKEIAPLLDAIGGSSLSAAYDASRVCGLRVLLARYPWTEALERIADDFDDAARRLVDVMDTVSPDADPMTLSADALESWQSVVRLTARLDVAYDLMVTTYQHREQTSWALFSANNENREIDLCVREGSERLTPQMWRAWSDPKMHLGRGGRWATIVAHGLVLGARRQWT